MMLMDRIARLSPTKRRLLALRLNVDTSYVSAPADDANPKRLLAYVVLDKNQTSTKEELRAYLKKRLPTYMVPSEFIEKISAACLVRSCVRARILSIFMRQKAA